MKIAVGVADWKLRVMGLVIAHDVARAGGAGDEPRNLATHTGGWGSARHKNAHS